MAVEEGVLVQVGDVVPKLLIRLEPKFLLQQFWLPTVSLTIHTIEYVHCSETVFF